MNEEEKILEALKICGEHGCVGSIYYPFVCPYLEEKNRAKNCVAILHKDTAALIERLKGGQP